MCSYIPCTSPWLLLSSQLSLKYKSSFRLSLSLSLVGHHKIIFCVLFTDLLFVSQLSRAHEHYDYHSPKNGFHSDNNLQTFFILRFSMTPCIGLSDHLWVKLLLFLSSKYAITMAFNTMYVFTAEMFPTELRMSLFGIASMFGRLGSMIAPQMSLLVSNMPIVVCPGIFME